MTTLMSPFPAPECDTKSIHFHRKIPFKIPPLLQSSKSSGISPTNQRCRCQSRWACWPRSPRGPGRARGRAPCWGRPELWLRSPCRDSCRCPDQQTALSPEEKEGGNPEGETDAWTFSWVRHSDRSSSDLVNTFNLWNIRDRVGSTFIFVGFDLRLEKTRAVNGEMLSVFVQMRTVELG